MTPEQMHARAITSLAEEFSRTHTDPHADANAWLARLQRDGWRPVTAIADRAGARYAAPPEVAHAALAEARAAVEAKHGSRPELAGGAR